MGYPDAAWERAMTVQEVILKALSGEVHWFRAAEILGWSPRTLRRWRERYEACGYAGLMDKRMLRPSVRRVPAGQVEQVLRLYRERYRGFNVRHFHQIARREHGVTVSYSFVKQTLQAAGFVRKQRARGRHRLRREPRACCGELLHIDGSTHAWFAHVPDARPCLIAVSDDATKRVLHAAFYPSESTRAVMTSLAAVFRREGLPMALYSDRAHWAFHTPKAKGPVDKTQLTQVGRALACLGVEHIPAYSPQARGRSERLNRTLQDRLVNELRVAGITTLEAANRYLVETFLPQHNATFARAPRDPASAFVPLGDVDLDLILCQEDARVVARDNTVCVAGQVLQIARQPGRCSCAGLAVTVRQHLDGRYTISRGTQRLGTFRPDGRPVDAAVPVDGRTHRPPARPPDRPRRAPAAPQRPPAYVSQKRSDHLSNGSGQITC
jgi:transposase